MGFFLGIACVFRGLGRLVTTPALWNYALAPVVLSAIFFGGGALLVRRFAAGPVGQWARELAGDSDVAEWAASAAVWVLAVVIMFLVFTSVVRVVAAPVLALLADRTVAEISGRPSPAAPGGPVLRFVVRPILEALQLLGVRLAVTVVALPLLLVPVVGGLFFSAVMMGLVGLDLLDIAQSARGVLFGARMRFIRSHAGACFGLGTGAGLLLLVPCVNVLLLPAVVVAGVVLDSRIAPDFPKAAAA